jgi:hypothetical protein
MLPSTGTRLNYTQKQIYFDKTGECRAAVLQSNSSRKWATNILNKESTTSNFCPNLKRNRNVLNVKDKCLEKRFCQKHVLQNDINGFPMEGTNMNFTADLHVWPTSESDENVHKMRTLVQNVRHPTVAIIAEPTTNRNYRNRTTNSTIRFDGKFGD